MEDQDTCREIFGPPWTALSSENAPNTSCFFRFLASLSLKPLLSRSFICFRFYNFLVYSFSSLRAEGFFLSFNPITCFRTVPGPAWLVASSSLFGFFCFSYSVYRRWDIWTFSQLPFSCCYFVVLPLSHLIVSWCEMLAVLARVEILGDWVGKLASWVGPIPPVEMVSSGLVHPSPRFL